MEYVTAKRAADMTGLSEKTIRRWVDNGKLAARKMADGRLAISVEHLPSRRVSDLDAQVAQLSMQLDESRAEIRALKRRIEALERVGVPIAVIGRSPSESTYSASQHRSMQGDTGLPLGWVPAVEYLLRQGISETTARRRLRRLQHHEGSWPNGVRYAFDPDQIAALEH